MILYIAEDLKDRLLAKKVGDWFDDFCGVATAGIEEA
jgi:hypothetical protein